MPIDDLQNKLRNFYIDQLAYGENVRIKEFSRIQAGWESEIYAFNLLVGEGQPQELILRIYPGRDAIEKSEREFNNLKRLASLNYPVPKVHYLESGNSVLGKPFVIMERVPGKPLWDTLFSEGREVQEGLINSLSRLYVKLHRLNYRPFTENPDEVIDQGSLWLVTSQIKRWREYYDNFPLPDFLPLINYLDDHVADLTSSMPAVLHWDFHPENIILQPDGSMTVIDWTGLQVSDLRFDLAWTLMLIAAYEGEHWREPFLESYARFAGGSITNMEFFDVAACTRRLFSIAVSISAGAEKLGMRPGAEENMRNQIRPTQAVYDMLLSRIRIHLPSLETWLTN